MPVGSVVVIIITLGDFSKKGNQLNNKKAYDIYTYN